MNSEDTITRKMEAPCETLWKDKASKTLITCTPTEITATW